MQKLSLSGRWSFRRSGTEDWLPCQVPGGVHTDLLALGLIPDPFISDHEKKVAWVAESDWEYRRQFNIEPDLLSQERVYLVCDGLDTLAQVSVNGTVLGETNNMFWTYTWDIKSYLVPGKNEITIAFHSPVAYITKRQAERPLPGVSQGIPGASYLRKAPCQFGWDWGPQLPPIGIWKDIRLEAYRQARLKDVHIRQQHDRGRVSLIVRVKVEKWGETDLEIGLHLLGPEDQQDASFEACFPMDGEEADITIDVSDPKLWWPNGYGPQPLYHLEVTLFENDQPLDEQTFQIGLRTLELRQQPDDWGKSFEFVVNGVRIFAKGSNWIPADSFPTRITFDRLEMLIRSAAETHQNMLRVWGGGFYEDDTFYDLCDRYGVLVWQEFIFSCSVYPLNDPKFIENIKEEVVQNVRRLRHRASLALWCGNNEMEVGWREWGWNKPNLRDLKKAYETFFFHTLPEWVSAEDPDRAYWPSSPSSNLLADHPQSQEVGDAHYWEVWHGRKPFSAYLKQVPRFMSEFGFQSLPPLETIRTYAEPSEWNMTSYVMEQHQKNASGNSLILSQMGELFRMPKDFPALVYLSMVLQAEGIRFGVEHWRRNQERVSGTLYWQLNDCWPVASWSSLDYFGRWKALHYAARRFYTPVLLSLVKEGQDVEIHLTNDTLEIWNGFIQWKLIGVDGTVYDQGQCEARIESQSSKKILTKSMEVPPDLVREVVFAAELCQGERRLALKVLSLVPDKHLNLKDPKLQIQVDEANEGSRDYAEIKVTAQNMARFVELSTENLDLLFGDNYFDVLPGDTVWIYTRIPNGIDLDNLRNQLRVRTLYDSYTH